MANWLETFNYRIPISVDSSKIDQSLTDFPVLIKISASSGISSANLAAVFDSTSYENRKKIAVTTSDGVTQCYVEIERWDSSNDVGYLHVKIPSIAADTDTVLYLYFGCSTENTVYVGDITETAARNVWDSDFVAVYHLKAAINGNYNVKDSTINAMHISGVNTEDADFTTNGIDLDGTNERIGTVGNTVFQPTSTVTTETVLSVDTYSDSNTCIMQYGKAAGQSYGLNINMYGTGTDLVGFHFYNSAWHFVEDTDIFPANTPTYVAGRYTGSELTIHVDDAVKNTTSYTGGLNYTTVAGFTIGAYYNGGAYVAFLDGLVKESRVSKIARSNAWLKSTYYSLFDNLLTYSSIDTIPELDWLSDWNYRLPITIDQIKVDEPLSNFPVTLTISASCGISTADLTTIFSVIATADMKKIAITTSDGVTECYVEIERWDSINSVAKLHVKVPSISHIADTVLYLYYDSTKTENTAYVGDIGETPAKSVWDSNYGVVYHTGVATIGTDNIKDSTSNSYHSFAVNMESADFTGAEAVFDGSNERTEWSQPTSVLVPVNTITIESLFTPTNVNGGRTLLSRMNRSGASSAWHMGYAVLNSTVNCEMVFYNTAWRVATNSYVAIGTDMHMVGRFTGTVATTWINGVNGGTLNHTGSFNYTGLWSLVIGSYWISPNWQGFINGELKEVRISIIARSDAWIKSTTHSLKDTLVTYGVVEDNSLTNDGDITVDTVVEGTLTARQYGSGELLVDCTIAGHLHRSDISGFAAITVDTTLVGRTKTTGNAAITVDDIVIVGELIVTNDLVITVGDIGVVGYSGASGEVTHSATFEGFTAGSGEVQADSIIEAYGAADGAIAVETVISAIGFIMRRDGEVALSYTFEGSATPNVIIGARCNGSLLIDDMEIAGKRGSVAGISLGLSDIVIVSTAKVNINADGAIAVWAIADIVIQGRTGFGGAVKVEANIVAVTGTMSKSEIFSAAITAECMISGTMVTNPTISGAVVVDSYIFGEVLDSTEYDILRYARPDVAETTGSDASDPTNVLRYTR